MIELFKLLQNQAETCNKWWMGQPVRPETSFDFYFNELTVLDNSILFNADIGDMALIGYNSLDYLFTAHSGFCNESKNYFQRQMSKSLKLSGTAEKERNKFFNRILERINTMRRSLD